MITKVPVSEIRYKKAKTEAGFHDARNLFQQYAGSLEIDLSFQNFSEELHTIQFQYNAPTGALILAYMEQTPVGCVAIRRIDDQTGELKRMFVLDQYRQMNIGRRLLELALESAKELNYTAIRLDTLPTMKNALHLYRSYGFHEIDPYRFNPVAGAVFMEKKL